MTRARRRPSPLIVLLALLAAGAVMAAVLVVGGSPAATNVSRRTVTASKGVVETVVSGTGNLAPSKELDLAFGTSGTVQRVYVKAGQHVVTGQVLARLDETTADVQLEQAQAQLTDAEDQLQRAQEAAASATSVPAVATVTRATPTPAPTSTPAPARTAAPSSGGGSGSSSAQSVPSAQAAVASAQLSVRQAEDAVEGTVLRAPMAGVVASVSGAEGDRVGGGSGSSATASSSSSSSAASSAFVTLVNLHRLTMEVQLSEADISGVRAGRPATVTIDALPDTEVAAHVRSIGVLSSASSSSTAGGTSSSGAVSYPVTLELDQRAPHLRPGMSATADIVTARARGVVVPSEAVRGSTVTVVRDGKQVQQRVDVGVTGDSSTQILTGVKAGEQVVVTSTTATAGRIAQAASSGGAKGLGGGTGFGGGARLRFGGGAPGGFGGGGP